MKQKLLTLKALFMVLMMTLGFGHAFAEDKTLNIDFESETTAYTDWTFSNMTSKKNTINAHNGSYYGNTDGKTTASVTTKEKIATPTSITCYYTKESTNTNSTSKFIIQVSTDGTSWTDVQSGKTMNNVTKSTWEELKANLTSYKNVYVRVLYSGTTAIRALDDVTLVYSVQTDKTSTTTTFNGESSYSVELGKTFTAPTATVKAGETAVTTPAVTYSSSKTEVATVNAETGAVTLVGAGSTTITASYAGNETYASSSASYTLTVTKPVPVFASLEELVAADLTSGTEVNVSFENVPIKSFQTVSSVRKGIYFNIQKGGNDIEIFFNSEIPAEWAVGGTVSGTLTNCPWKLYNSTWELAPASGWAWTNLSYTASTVLTAPSFTTQPVNATYDWNESAKDLTIDATGNPNPTYQWYSNTTNSNENGTLLDGETNKTYKPSTATPGTFYYYCVATNSEGSVASNVATITINEPVVATLPFSFDGGKNDIATTDGMSHDGLGNDYSLSPKLKFDSQDDYVIINFNEAAKKVTYTIKGNSTSGTYAFDVMESADGVNYTTVHSHTSITDATSYTDNLASTSRFVKFVYTTKDNGNVALGKISIVAANAVENPELAFAKTSYRFLTTDSEKSVSASSAKGSTGAITYSCDNTNLTIDATTGIITCSTAGTYTVKASIAAVEGYEAADATCTVTVIEPAVANSIIVAETNDGKFFAMTNTANSSGYLVSVEINKIDNKYYVSEENYDEVLYAVSSTENSVTIVNKFNEYLQATAAKNVSFIVNEYKWTLADNVLTAANPDHGTLQYNSSNPRFTTYGTKIGSYATIVSLDNVVKSNTATANLQITDAGVATFCAPFDVDLNKVEGVEATAYKATVDDGWVKLSEIESGVIEAGTAVVLQGAEMSEEKTLTGVPATTEATCTTGCLTGNLSVVTSVAIGNFLLQKQTAGLAWYKVTEEGLKIGTNRCYLTKEAVSDARTVLNMDLNPTGIDSIATEAKTKADGKYLVNGKIVVVKAGKVYDLK